MDKPKSLGDASVRQSRIDMLNKDNIKPLTIFVENLRTQMGASYEIPYFDPLDGGVNASCLFLLEAPGSKAVASGFISRNNPDETARNFFLLNQEAGINRENAIIWNIVPWYVGNGQKIRAVKSKDIREAEPDLQLLLLMLDKLKIVVLLGCKAWKAEDLIHKIMPSVKIVRAYHPSPLFINRLPQNRDLVLAAFKDVAQLYKSK